MNIEEAIKIAQDLGIFEKAYPNNRLINCRDKNGTIHSFYMNGTCMFRRFLGDKHGKTVKLTKPDPNDIDIMKRFIWFCDAVANKPTDIANFFKE